MSVFYGESLKNAISQLRMERLANVLTVPRQQTMKSQTDLGSRAENAGAFRDQRDREA